MNVDLDSWDAIIISLIIGLLFIFMVLTKDVGYVLQKLVEISLFGLITGYFIKKLVSKG
jgi:hypothetical protein